MNPIKLSSGSAQNFESTVRFVCFTRVRQPTKHSESRTIRHLVQNCCSTRKKKLLFPRVLPKPSRSPLFLAAPTQGSDNDRLYKTKIRRIDEESLVPYTSCARSYGQKRDEAGEALIKTRSSSFSPGRFLSRTCPSCN